MAHRAESGVSNIALFAAQVTNSRKTPLLMLLSLFLCRHDFHRMKLTDAHMDVLVPVWENQLAVMDRG